jgi:DNA-directed RNA polymerase specialized sigma24 family protein
MIPRGCAIFPIDPSDAGDSAPDVDVATPAVPRPELLWRAKALIDMTGRDEIRLAWRKFHSDKWRGPDWIAFRQALFGAGMRTLLALRRAGLIKLAGDFARPPEWTSRIPQRPQDYRDFVIDACTKQIAAFEHRARTGHDKAWRPDGGASPLTWFVRGVARDLPNLARAWERAHRHEETEEPVDEIAPPGDPVLDLEEAALSRCEFEQILRKAPPLVADGLRRKAEGWLDKEIAKQQGISVRKLRTDRGAFLKKIQNERGIE